MAALEIHNIGYFFSDPKKQPIPIWTKEQLDDVLKIRPSETAYVSEQEYYNNDIHKYRTIVLSGVSEERYKLVQELYNLRAEVRYLYGGEWFYKFRLHTPLHAAKFNDLSSILALIYNCNIQHYYPYKPNLTEELDQSDNMSGVIESIKVMIDDRNRTLINDPKNNDQIEQSNRLPIADVVARSKAPHTKIDEHLGIIVGYGSPFSYIKHVYKSINAAYRFFQAEFDIEFINEEETTEHFMLKGVMPVDGLIQKKTQMGYEGAEGKFIKCTDFIIYVHYRIIRPHEISYIVSLEGEASVKHIEWKNFSGENELTRFLHALGPFHYFGGKLGFSKVHEYISHARVPEITTVNKFGVSKLFDKKYLIYADAVIDIDSKMVIEPWKDSDIFFLSGTKGIKVETAAGLLLREELGEKTPYLGKINPSLRYADIEEVFKKIFLDSSSDMLMFTLCTWMGNALYNDYIDCPLFFATGPSGSGKTTYSRILSTVFGIQKPLSLEGTTPFPLRMGLTYIDSLPFFMSEFRTRMASVYEKTQILKALFDGTPFERGRKDLSIEKSVFSAAGFIEGEELPESGATRTRLLIHTLTRSGQNPDINPDEVIQENIDKLKSFQYSYIANTNKDEFRYHLSMADDVFSGMPIPSIRILSSIKLIYASVMSYCPNRMEEITEKLRAVLNLQISDYKRNATGMEVVRIAQRYLQSKWAKIYIKGYDLILPWEELGEYIQRSHTNTELSFDSYQSNLEGMGFEFGFFEVDDESDGLGSRQMLLKGMKVYAENIPDEFKCHPDVYSMVKDYLSKRVITSKK